MKKNINMALRNSIPFIFNSPFVVQAKCFVQRKQRIDSRCDKFTNEYFVSNKEKKVNKPRFFLPIHWIPTSDWQIKEKINWQLRWNNLKPTEHFCGNSPNTLRLCYKKSITTLIGGIDWQMARAVGIILPNKKRWSSLIIAISSLSPFHRIIY